MTTKVVRRTARFLTSPRVAITLIALIGAWLVLGSFVPQGDPSVPTVAAWASANPTLEPVVRALGLHQAFSAPLFLACVALLALCTTACAWQRTRVATKRTRMLRSFRADGPESPSAAHDLELVCDPPLRSEDILTTITETLERLGISAKRSGQTVTAASPLWSVWGSAVFHWALVALIVALPLGSLVRSSGQIGLAVGQSAPDEPASYGILTEGPLHSWDRADRTVRLDAFDITYEARGVNRGPTPRVSILNADGEVLDSQRVYPNHTLKHGSLTIYPVDYGLSATVAILDASGAEVQRMTQLLDFSGEAEGGTTPVTPLVARDADGTPQFRMFISVPLDETEGGYAGRVPEQPRARILVVQESGEAVLDRTVALGEEVALPMGGGLRLVDVGYYSRLQLVDDPSVPLLYLAAVVAMLGLGVATLARQILLVARVEEDREGTRVLMTMRLWRILSTTREEVETELREALGAIDRGSEP